MTAFRDWWQRDWPDDAAFARGVDRLLADANTDFLVGAVGDAGAGGVAALRYRYGLWFDAPDCTLEDLFVEEPARRSGLGSGSSCAPPSIAPASAAVAAWIWT